MTPTPPSDFSISFSEVEWLRFMTSDKRRPNVLVSCFNSGVGPVVARLTSVCARPVHNRHLPGPLNLPGGHVRHVIAVGRGAFDARSTDGAARMDDCTPAGCANHLGDGGTTRGSGRIAAVLRRALLPAQRDHASRHRRGESGRGPARQTSIRSASSGARLHATRSPVNRCVKVRNGLPRRDVYPVVPLRLSISGGGRKLGQGRRGANSGGSLCQLHGKTERSPGGRDQRSAPRCSLRAALHQ